MNWKFCILKVLPCFVAVIASVVKAFVLNLFWIDPAVMVENDAVLARKVPPGCESVIVEGWRLVS